MRASFVWPERVYYENTDAGGVVYHAQYLHFYERARTEWLRHLGFSQQALRAEQGVLIVVRHMDIAFIKPALLDDEITIHTELVALKRASMTLQQTISLSAISAKARALDKGHSDQAQSVLLNQTQVQLAVMDAAVRTPCRMPTAMRTALLAS